MILRIYTRIYGLHELNVQEVKFELYKDKISLIDNYQVNDQVSSQTHVTPLAHSYSHILTRTRFYLVASDTM